MTPEKILERVRSLKAAADAMSKSITQHEVDQAVWQALNHNRSWVAEAKRALCEEGPEQAEFFLKFRLWGVKEEYGGGILTVQGEEKGLIISRPGVPAVTMTYKQVVENYIEPLDDSKIVCPTCSKPAFFTAAEGKRRMHRHGDDYSRDTTSSRRRHQDNNETPEFIDPASIPEWTPAKADFTLNDSTNLRVIASIASRVLEVEDIEVLFGSDGMSFTSMDGPHYSLCSVFCPATSFTAYVTNRPFTVAMKTEDLMSGLSHLKKEPISIHYDEQEEVVHFSCGTRKFDIATLPPWQGIRPLPEVKFTAKFVVGRKALLALLNDARSFDSVRVTATKERMGFHFHSHLDSDSNSTLEDSFAVGGKEVVSAEVSEETKQTYGVMYLISILKAVPTDVVTFEYATDKPCRLTFNLEDGSSVTYWLAPRQNE